MKARIPLGVRAVAALSVVFAGTRIGNGIDTFFDRYEGAQPSSPRRSGVPNFVRDARFDINSFTRWELTRKVRYFEANNWLVQRLADLFEQYTVGPTGLQVVPNSSDSEWNKAALESWQTWCQFPDLSSRQPFSVLQGLIARSWFIDGDVFVLKTYGKDRPGKQAYPRIQLVESHRVSSPGQQYSWDDNDATTIDGVKVDPITGRPIGYYMRSSFDGDEYSLKDADNVIQVFEPCRAGQLRGITFFHSVLNNLHDMDDLQVMEMDRAKQACAIGNIYETWNGEMNMQNMRVNALRGIATGVTTPTDQSMAQRIQQFQTIFGSRSMAIKPGEKISQMGTVQPSAATQWYWDYLTGTVCLGVGISKGLALPTSMQGTVVRQDLSACAGFFRSRSAVMASAVSEIYKHWANWARYNDPKLFDAPADWYATSITPPSAVDVDPGRNAVGVIASIAAGTSNFTLEYGSRGMSATEQFRIRAREVIAMKQIAAEESAASGGFTVSAEEMSSNLADVALKLAEANQADALADQASNSGETKDPVDA